MHLVETNTLTPAAAAPASMGTAIDLFAGLGGNTLGAKKAGINVVWAANHNPLVVDYHGQNHPEVEHSCQDLQQAVWSRVPSHDIMLASPCCQGFTPARGKDGAHHDESRSTAWAPLSCAEYHKPEMIFIENVPFFFRWPLYDLWLECFRRLGYTFAEYTLDAADGGFHQNRERAFLLGTRSKHPIELKMETYEQRPVLEILDVESGKWSKVDKPGRAAATLKRVANGRRQFGDLFVMPYYGSGSGLTGRSIHRPVGTITTVDGWAIVKGDEMRMFSVDEYRRAMTFPKETKLPPQKRPAVNALGNATCPKHVAQILTAALKAA